MALYNKAYTESEYSQVLTMVFDDSRATYQYDSATELRQRLTLAVYGIAAMTLILVGGLVSLIAR